MRKAIKTGRITLEPDGTIDPDRADREWEMRTDPAQQRGEHSQALGVEVAAAMAREKAQAAPSAPGTKPVPAAAIQAFRDTLREAGEDTGPGTAANGEVSIQKVRVAHEVIKVQMGKIRLGRMQDQLVDRPKAQALVFDAARRERDAWVGWPARVAANVAAELGVDPHRTEEVLDRYLREHLAGLSDVKIDLR